MTWFPTPAYVRERERSSLADALLELVLDAHPMTAAELAAEARAEWGACTDAEVRTALRWLAQAGWIEPDGDGYIAGGER